MLHHFKLTAWQIFRDVHDGDAVDGRFAHIERRQPSLTSCADDLLAGGIKSEIVGSDCRMITLQYEPHRG